MIALCNATIIDGSGHPPFLGSLVIKGEKIEYVGSSLPSFLTKDDEYYNAEGMTLLPGLIDTHTHIQLTPGDDALSFLRESVPLRTLKAAKNAKKTLESGFTTIRDLGAEDLVDLGVRDAINEGIMIGPRILASGYKIMPTGADFQVFPSAVEFPGRITMDSPHAVRREVRKLLALGVDLIKIMTSGRTFRKSSSPDAIALTLEEAKAAVFEAHNQNVRVSAHAHGNRGVKIALEAGCDTIEHATSLEEDDLAFMVKKGVFMIPTLSYSRRIMELGGSCPLPSYSREKALLSRERRLVSFSKALEAGAPIAMGSDAGMPYVEHGGNALEIEELVRAGMSPMEALISSTSLAAKALGVEREVGSLKGGMAADMILVHGDPLEDILCLQDLKRILGVIKGGAVVVDRGFSALRRKEMGDGFF